MLQAVKKELEASVTSLTQKCSDLEMHRSTLAIIYGIECKKVDSLRDQNSMLWGRALKAERALSKLQEEVKKEVQADQRNLRLGLMNRKDKCVSAATLFGEMSCVQKLPPTVTLKGLRFHEKTANLTSL